jgi:hypothetical protein
LIKKEEKFNVITKEMIKHELLTIKQFEILKKRIVNNNKTHFEENKMI